MVTDNEPEALRVLLLEPDDLLREVLVDTLAEEAYRVRAVQNAAEALPLLRAEPPTLLILSASNEGVLDLVPVARACHEEPALQQVRLLLLSALPTIAMQAESLGVETWLRLPFHLDDLLARIHHVLEAPAPVRLPDPAALRP